MTDDPIVADSSIWRIPYVQEIRDTLNEFSTQCVCETEHCQYCSNCGHAYVTCTHGCYCQNSKYAQCTYCANTWNWSCSVNNTYSAGADFPYSDYPVPWNCMCSHTPAGMNWQSCEYRGAHDHSDWGCKCTPYTWP